MKDEVRESSVRPCEGRRLTGCVNRLSACDRRVSPFGYWQPKLRPLQAELSGGYGTLRAVRAGRSARPAPERARESALL